MFKRFAALTAVLFALAIPGQAQSLLQGATPAGSALTVNAPAACVTGSTCSATISYCSGAASACSLTGAVWNKLTVLTGVVAGTPVPYQDNSQPLGAPVTYTVQFSQGSIVGSPLPTYTGTPVSPLAGGSFSGTTS